MSNVPSGLPYGQRARMEESISTAPLAGGRREATDQAARQARVAALQRNAARVQPPPPITELDPNTTNNMPVTAGIDMGDGPGSGSLPDPRLMAAQRGVDPNLNAFLPYAAQMEAAASRPGASAEMRQFVRRLRSMLPANTDGATIADRYLGGG